VSDSTFVAAKRQELGRPYRFLGEAAGGREFGGGRLDLEGNYEKARTRFYYSAGCAGAGVPDRQW